MEVRAVARCPFSIPVEKHPVMFVHGSEHSSNMQLLEHACNKLLR